MSTYRHARSAIFLAPVLALALVGCTAPNAGTPPEQPSQSASSGTVPGPTATSSPNATTSPDSTSSPSATPTPSSSPDANQRARDLVDELDVSEQAALLVMAGVPAAGASTAEINTLAKAGIGSVFLRGRSQLSVSQTRAKVGQITKRLAGNVPGDLPVWVATDQEGGFVRVLQGPGFTELPTAQAQGRWSQSRLRTTISRVGDELAEAGVNVNLAPVADTVPESLGEGNAPIGYWKRNYGFNPTPVSMAVRQINEALHEAGVQPVVKHFPGLGRVSANTDTAAEAVDRTTGAKDDYLVPFTDSINQDLAWVMVSNAVYPKLDAKNPAPFSKAVITDLLRDQLGYERLVISDDLCEAKAVSGTKLGQRAVEFIRAGGTLALCVQADDALRMVQALTAEAKADPKFAEDVKQAATLVVSEHLRAEKD